MSRTDRVAAVAQQILDAFESGDLPPALAQVLITRDFDCPAASWSYRNRLLVALAGHHDARGFRQWQEVGRSVRKGEKAFYILAPVMRRVRSNDQAEPALDEERDRRPEKELRGFRATAVFGASQTEGDPLPHETEEAHFLDQLPLVEVARTWGIKLGTFVGTESGRLGFFQHAPLGDELQRIGLGTRNLATWAHELVHAADKRRGTLKPSVGQELSNEVVAELGGAVLLECIGETAESDRGGAYRYIEAYATEHDRSVLSVVSELVDRACAAVALILDTADQLAAGPEALSA